MDYGLNTAGIERKHGLNSGHTAGVMDTRSAGRQYRAIIEENRDKHIDHVL